RRGRTRAIVWSLAAVASLLMVGIFGVPAIGERLIPLVPFGFERRLGEAVDAQVRVVLDTGPPGRPFECGTGARERSGRAALDRLVGRLEAAAGLPVRLRVAVVRRDEPNAIALPGGTVYLYAGLIARSELPDQLAAVIAHEIGHIANRDGTRAMLQTASLSFLFGLLLGDFVGGGAVVIAAKTLLQPGYSRAVEATADRYAVDLMNKVGGDARALGAILGRIAGAIEPGPKGLDHPDTRERVAAIDAAAAPRPGRALLEPAEWDALRRI